MNSLLTALLVLLSVAHGMCASHHVRAGAVGSASGNDWTDAYVELPASLTRGDTYYIADGTYTYYEFNDAVSGSSVITVQKATPSDHGTSTGWLDSYGDGQAVMGPGYFYTAYYTINGVTGSGSSSRGLAFTQGGNIPGNNGAIAIFNNYDASNLTFKNVEMYCDGPGTQANHAFSYGLYCNSFVAHDWVFTNCYIHNCYIWMGLSSTYNVMIDHCYFKNAGSSWADGFEGLNYHAAGITIKGTNVTIRYSVLENMIGFANTCYIEPQTGCGNTYIYGNVLWASDANEMCTQYALWSWTASETGYDNQIYNNTIFGLHGPCGVSGGNVDGSTGILVRNNIWQNCAETPLFLRVNTQDNNILNTGAVLFSGTNSGNFHLASQTAPGVLLSSPFATDPDGVARLFPSLGAYEFVNIPRSTSGGFVSRGGKVSR